MAQRMIDIVRTGGVKGHVLGAGRLHEKQSPFSKRCMEKAYGTLESTLSATLYLLYPILSIPKIPFSKKLSLILRKNFVNTDILFLPHIFLGGCS
jgi:hypothetical protein